MSSGWALGRGELRGRSGERPTGCFKAATKSDSAISPLPFLSKWPCKRAALEASIRRRACEKARVNSLSLSLPRPSRSAIAIEFARRWIDSVLPARRLLRMSSASRCGDTAEGPGDEALAADRGEAQILVSRGVLDTIPKLNGSLPSPASLGVATPLESVGLRE